MTKDELLEALMVERHNGIAWRRESIAHAEAKIAREWTERMADAQAEDDELEAARRRRLMAADFERGNKKEAM